MIKNLPKKGRISFIIWMTSKPVVTNTNNFLDQKNKILSSKNGFIHARGGQKA